MADIVGIIPARGGSKRLPRKALMYLGRAPLIEWTCASAAQSELLTRRVVITDDQEIARHASNAEIHTEPPELAGDAIHDAEYIGQCATALGLHTDDILVLLRPTSPFRRPQDIDAVVRMMLAQEDLSYSVRSVSPAVEYPEKAYTEEIDGLLRPLSITNAANGPGHILPQAWYPSGYVDAVRVYMVTEMGSLDGWRIGKFETPTERCVDIDTLEDFGAADRAAWAHGWTPGSVE